MISHQNIIAQCLQLIPTTSPDHKTVLGMLPFYHSTDSSLHSFAAMPIVRVVTGVVKMLVLPFVIGAEVVILPQFTMKGLLSTIERYQIAEVQVVPPIIIRLVSDPVIDDYDLSCIKRFASGAAPISKSQNFLIQARDYGRWQSSLVYFESSMLTLRCQVKKYYSFWRRDSLVEDSNRVMA